MGEWPHLAWLWGIALFAASPQALAQATTSEGDTRAAQPSVSSVAEPPRSRPVLDDLPEIREELERQRVALAVLQASSADDAPRVRLSGYVQVDWVVHNQSSQNEINEATGVPLNQDRFTLRRGHVRVDAEQGLLSGVLEIDANTTNGAQVRPIDAEVAMRYPERPGPNDPWVRASAGLMKIPFGFEVPELDSVRPFLERSTLARALFPGEFDLGARLSAHYRFLDATVALMNGSPIGDRAFPALAPSAHKELVARLATQLELVPGLTLDSGISADVGNGFHQGTPTTKDTLVWRDENGDGLVQATEVQVIAGSSATPSSAFQRFAVGADARLAVHVVPEFGFDIRVEVMRASNLDRGLEVADPVGAGRDLRELGWYLGATQELTRWAVIGVRYDRYNPDQDASEQQAAVLVPRDRSYSTLAFLAILRYARARLSFEYDVNRNALGRDSNGAPTNLASNSATLRAQVVF